MNDHAVEIVRENLELTSSKTEQRIIRIREELAAIAEELDFTLQNIGGHNTATSEQFEDLTSVLGNMNEIIVKTYCEFHQAAVGVSLMATLIRNLTNIRAQKTDEERSKTADDVIDFMSPIEDVDYQWQMDCLRKSL